LQGVLDDDDCFAVDERVSGVKVRLPLPRERLRDAGAEPAAP